MTAFDFTISYLKAVEKTHQEYFLAAKTSIFNCVTVSGTELISVHILNKELPPDIQTEIQTMFWVD